MKATEISPTTNFSDKAFVRGAKKRGRPWRGFFSVLALISFTAIFFGESNLFWILLALVFISIPVWRILKKLKMAAETTVVQAELWDSERIQNMTKLILVFVFFLGTWVLKLIGFKPNIVNFIIGGVMGFFVGKKLMIAGFISDKDLLRLDKFLGYSDFLEKAFP